MAGTEVFAEEALRKPGSRNRNRGVREDKGQGSCPARS